MEFVVVLRKVFIMSPYVILEHITYLKGTQGKICDNNKEHYSFLGKACFGQNNILWLVNRRRKCKSFKLF